MILSALALFLQTLLALAALGLAGTVVLVPFRHKRRPFLALAAPLAGIGAMSASLTVLYRFCHLPLALSVLLALALLVPPALYWLVSLRHRVACRPAWFTMLTVITAVAAWTLYATSRTTIQCGEPTVCLRDGSDALGYAAVADWITLHTQSEKLAYDPSHPAQAYPHAIHGVDDRPGAFFLAALARWYRGTSALFAYDWAIGLGLCAGILGIAGAIAHDRRSLLLLVTIGVLSAWYSLSRTGYLGKVLAYPGCIMLGVLFQETWRRGTLARVGACAVLGFGVSLCHNPFSTTAVLGLVATGTVAALLVSSASPGRWLPSLQGLWSLTLHVFRGAALSAVMLVPGLTFQYLTRWYHAPKYDVPWTFEWAVALDLESCALPIVGPKLSAILIVSTMLVTAAFIAIALRRRSTDAAGWLLALLIVPTFALLGRKEMLQFTGLVFPLTAVGAVLVLQNLRASRSAWVYGGVFAMALLLVGLRAPQFLGNFERYGRDGADATHCFVKSEMDELARRMGDCPTNVTVSDLYTGLVLLVEYGSSDLRLQFQEPTWSRIVGFTRWPVPQYPTPGQMVLGDSGSSPAQGAILFRNRQFTLATIIPEG